MSRTTHRALTVLALSAALAIGTTAVAVAAEDLNEQRKALYQSELDQNLKAAAPVEDQNDRLLRGIETATAQRTQAALERVRSGERELGPVPVVTIAAQPVPAADRGVDPIAIVLLALVGGLVGGAAWTAASRRRPNRAVAA